jgi:large subunit ribosomal protein L32
MPVPKRKRSRARRDSRFANKGMDVKSFGKCPNCQEVLLPHQACKGCGHYKGVKVVTTKLERVVKRAQARQAKQQREASAAPQQESASQE